MPKRETDLHVRLTDGEMELLRAYAEQSGVSVSDVIRALIRGLKRRIES